MTGDECSLSWRRKVRSAPDLAEDISAALAANPAAAAFFDTLAQFYRKPYLRWIGAITGRGPRGARR